MFEFEQEIVNSLLNADDDFKRLYNKHEKLKQQVNEINLGIKPADDYSLGNLKKEKLLLKDRMANMIADYRQSHA
jgi:hypothetical protein